MQPKWLLAARAPFALTAALLVPMAHLPAAQGRNFAGTFWVSGVNASETEVQFEMAVQLSNQSETDVQNAQLRIADRSPRGLAADPEISGSVSDISIPAHESVVVHGTFHVPAADFAQWERGAVPPVVIRYFDAAGSRVEEPVDLVLQTQPVPAARQAADPSRSRQ